MTELLFREDAYLQQCEATVSRSGDGVIVLDRTVFYPLGGGQPGDCGVIRWQDGSTRIVGTRHGEGGAVQHIATEDEKLPAPGTTVSAVLDWDLRYRHMRMHTALHLLGAVLRYGVTGGNISAAKSRLDFDMEEGVDKEQVTADMQALVDADHAVTCRWITDEELAAKPELVRTMSVQPPRGAGKVRLLEIADVDLQPCGGTHLKSTGEVGTVRVSKVEKKGRHNRRVSIVLDD